MYTNVTHQIFEELVPLVLPLLKKHIKLGHAGILDHSVDLSIPDKKVFKKGMDRTNKKLKILCKWITTNMSAIWQQQPNNLLLLAAKQEPYKKAYL